MMKSRYIILYGCSLALVVLLLQWMEYRLLVIDHATEIYITMIAIIFTVLGIWLATHLMKPKTLVKTETVVIEKEVMVYKDNNASFTINETMIRQLGMSLRELEVLQLMAAGNSNQEIADKLYVSLNTVKTHSSRLFEKLDVRRRTQAIEKAKRLNIIP